MVILTAPSQALRNWWCGQLHVAPHDLVVLTPSRQELEARIIGDPTRCKVRELHFQLVKQWYQREQRNDPGYVSTACDEQGYPIDSLHPWNQGINSREVVA